MATYKVKVSRHYVYEIDVEATDEISAIDAAREWEIEDLEPYEGRAWFETDVIGYPDATATEPVQLCANCAKETMGYGDVGHGQVECKPCYERGIEN